MSQGDQFHQYGYDHYLKAPRRGGGCYRSKSVQFGGSGLLSSLLYYLGSSVLLRKLQSPLVAGGVLVVAVLLFVGVIAMTYSSGESDDKLVPIVKAELGEIKMSPGNPGGMDIPHRQSTILARSDQPSAEEQKETVENLIASQGREYLVSKEEAFDRATQSPMMGEEGDVISFDDQAEAQDDLAALHAQAQGAIDVYVEPDVGEAPVNVSSSSSAVSGDLAVVPAFEIEKPAAEEILQKIGSSKSDRDNGDMASSFSPAFVNKTARAAVVEKPTAPFSMASSLLSAPVTSSSGAAVVSKPDPARLHGAGQSPETLEYVRSVLEKKSHDSGDVQVHGAAAYNDIEPALGVSAEIALGTGSYFVQLASITDARRAPEEWAKMQNKYSVLASSKFRVQEAALPSGTFYRIQAGPMSKDSANQVCDALKQADKPGGCLVVK